MDFIFKPEKLTSELTSQAAEAIDKRAELASRKKYPGLWEKTDALNKNSAPEEVLRRRKTRHVIYGVFLIAIGIFLFVPGIMKPKELFVPLIVGAFSFINGIFAVLPRKTPAERYERKAGKIMENINFSLNPEDTVVFGEEAIFENGALLMEYDDLEEVIETRSLFLVCDGTKIMLLRKLDLVSGDVSEFGAHILEKTGKSIIKCS